VLSFWKVRNIIEDGDNGVCCPFGKYVIYRKMVVMGYVVLLVNT
jgi:hypothetical protein